MTLTLAQQTRQRIQLAAMDMAPGLPRLPHIPQDLSRDTLSPKQQEENLLHVALWIVEWDSDNLDMETWHSAWDSAWHGVNLDEYLGEEFYHTCGTVHCIAGFAQVMAGPSSFRLLTEDAGFMLLGKEACSHFRDENEEGLEFLKKVIARNSQLIPKFHNE